MRWRATRHVTTLCLSIAVLSCNAGDFFCISDPRPALEIEVRDSVNGRGVAFLAVGEARSFVGTFALEPGLYGGSADSLLLVGGWNRWGLFQVVVTRAGYREWTASNVLVDFAVVGSRNCTQVRPTTLRLEARLQLES